MQCSHLHCTPARADEVSDLSEEHRTHLNMDSIDMDRTDGRERTIHRLSVWTIIQPALVANHGCHVWTFGVVWHTMCSIRPKIKSVLVGEFRNIISQYSYISYKMKIEHIFLIERFII
jgi:hypothetical protein